MVSLFCLYGAPGTIRTCDRLVRSQVLYPAELRALCGGAYSIDLRLFVNAEIQL